MKDIKGFEGIYAVNEDGQIWSYPRVAKRSTGDYEKKGQWLVQSPGKVGYNLVTLYDGKGNIYKMAVHRIVAETFLSRLQVNHKNGIKTDNRVENLEWVTPSQNILHALQKLKVGSARGERSRNAKMTDEKVREMRRLYANGGVTQRELGFLFGLDNSNVSRIVNRQDWAHVV